MYRIKQLLIILFVCLMSSSASAAMYDIEMSTNAIVKDSSFGGGVITISGLKRGNTQIIASVTGPNKSYTIWKKKKKMGIWVNGERLDLHSAFSFYQIYATDSLEKITNYDTLKILSFNLDYSDYFVDQNYSKAEMILFNQAFKSHQQYVGQYLDSINPIETIGGSIFRISVKLHRTAPIGEYVVKIVEFDGSQVSQIERLTFQVSQDALNAKIDDLVQQNSLIYALIAILIALTIGGATGFILHGHKV